MAIIVDFFILKDSYRKSKYAGHYFSIKINRKSKQSKLHKICYVNFGLNGCLYFRNGWDKNNLGMYGSPEWPRFYYETKLCNAWKFYHPGWGGLKLPNILLMQGSLNIHTWFYSWIKPWNSWSCLCIQILVIVLHWTDWTIATTSILRSKILTFIDHKLIKCGN